MLNSSFLSRANGLDNDLLNTWSYLIYLFVIILEYFTEELSLRHYEISFLISYFTIVFLNTEVGQMLIRITYVVQVILWAADAQVELAKHVNLERVEARDENPLSDIKLATFIEML